MMPEEYRVMLRPLCVSRPVMPDVFESMWAASWGASTTVIFKTHLKPHAPSICESMDERCLHVVAKGHDKVYFCAQEVAYNLGTQRPGTGYSTARRGNNAASWSVSPGNEHSPLVLCELKILSKEEIWIELRTDEPSGGVIKLYVDLFESMLRSEHGVYVRKLF